MRFCQLCQFVCGTLPQAKGCVSCVSPPPGAFSNRPVAGGVSWDSHYVEENTRGDRLPQLTKPLGKIYELDEPEAEMRLDPRAQNILDVLTWTAEKVTRKHKPIKTMWDVVAARYGARTFHCTSRRTRSIKRKRGRFAQQLTSRNSRLRKAARPQVKVALMRLNSLEHPNKTR